MATIIQGDVLEFLQTVPDDSADYIIADPPYFIGFDGGRGWDSQWGSEGEYLEWCWEWTRECARILRPGRTLTVFGTLKTDTFLRYKLEVLNEVGLQDHGEIIWSYNWGGRSKKDFARKHEYAWNYSKGSEFLFNGDDVRTERKMKNNPRTGQPFTKGTIPTRVWEFNNHTTSKDFVNWHPTTKNLSVLDRLIRGYSNPGDVVLDLFGGSASTSLAAVRSGRDYIYVERDADFVVQSRERLRGE